MPLAVGASSKVLVAFDERTVLESVLADPNWPENVNRQGYQEQLAEILQLGYAMSVEERELGAAAISAPIFNRNGKLVAAVAVSGPSNRMTTEVMKEFAEPIMEAAKRMGKMLK